MKLIRKSRFGWWGYIITLNFLLSGINSITMILIMLYHGSDILSEVSCTLHLWFSRANSIGNVMTICLISFERFLAIFFPFKSMSWVTNTRIKKASDPIIELLQYFSSAVMRTKSVNRISLLSAKCRPLSPYLPVLTVLFRFSFFTVTKFARNASYK